MLSSVLNSKTAIEINKGIMRAFVAVRQLIARPPGVGNTLLRQEMEDLKAYIEEMFADRNDINENTRMQLVNHGDGVKVLSLSWRSSS